MNQIIHFLKLARYKNLLIIILTMFLVRYGLIGSLLNSYLLLPALPLFYFLLLVLSVVCISGAGYIINDYFDTKTDLINRPHKVLIGREISRRHAMLAHTILTSIGIIIGFCVAYLIGNYKLGFVHVFSSGLLWYYSTTFKKEVLIGNVIISLLTALVPLTVMAYEMPPLQYLYYYVMKNGGYNLDHIPYFCLGFSLFAFLLTFVREIVKDLEDMEGDEEAEMNTLPIAWGVWYSKIIGSILIIGTLWFLFFIYKKQFINLQLLSTLYLLFLVAIPLIISMVLLILWNTPKKYEWLSKLLKSIMLAGVFYTCIMYYLSYYGSNY